jgi:hypothetical protein
VPIIAGSRLVRALAVLGGGGLAAGSLLATAAPAQAAVALTCGATVTSSVKLSQNVNCTGNSVDDAITVAAAGVTINLNGHKILGPGDLKDTGGIVDDGYDKVTIENGTISNFWYGVSVSGTSTSEVTGLRVQQVTITENTLGDENYGVYGIYLSKASMTELTIDSADIGVELYNSRHCSVTSSHLAIPLTGFEDIGGTGDAWTHTTMSDVSDVGVFELDSINAAVTSNTITGGATALGVEDVSVDSLIARNKLNALNTGIEIAGNVIAESGAVGATISDNTGVGDAYGIYANEPINETYIGNNFSKGAYGIEADYPRDLTIKLNITDSNSDAGVYVYVSGGLATYSATLSRNTAEKNQFGLYSQIRAKGGSNHASGNSVVNCHNVACVKS